MPTHRAGEDRRLGSGQAGGPSGQQTVPQVLGGDCFQFQTAVLACTARLRTCVKHRYANLQCDAGCGLILLISFETLNWSYGNSYIRLQGATGALFRRGLGLSTLQLAQGVGLEEIRMVRAAPEEPRNPVDPGSLSIQRCRKSKARVLLVAERCKASSLLDRIDCAWVSYRDPCQVSGEN